MPLAPVTHSNFNRDSVKLRRGGNSQNFVVHKHYYDRSAAWREVRVEENRGNANNDQPEKPVEDDDALQFGRIDQRHLTNLNIVRQRIIKLLQSSENEMVPYNNIAIRIVCLLSSRHLLSPLTLT